MLSSLKINNVAIIEESEITYENGLNVMTGETGSGKSIIIDSINAVLGNRTSHELIRDGSSSAKVAAVFENIGKSALDYLSSVGIDCPDNTLLIQRSITEKGNRCIMNGETVTLAVLKKAAPYLINIHGQNDNRQLLDENNHITYIDLIAENEDLRNQYSEKFSELKKINKSLKALRTDEYEKERKLDTLKYQINEIETAQIKEGEKEELTNIKNRLLNIEKMKKELSVSDLLIHGTEDDQGIISLLYSLSEHLAKLGEYYPQTSSYNDEIRNFISVLSECGEYISGELNGFESGDYDINSVEERLDIIYNLTKKYGGSEEHILSYLDKIKLEYEDLNTRDERLAELTNRYNERLNELSLLADKLTETRAKACKSFSENVTAELAYLNMEGAVFNADISQGALTSSGRDKIVFTISANKGQSFKPLSKTASGGELSRIMLAIKCVLMNKDNADTVIFDEIDAGVSGYAAEKIGYKLKEVSSFSQVICVTHLAQIAVFADNHLFIEKKTDENKTFTVVKKMTREERVKEIARIIGTSNTGESTLKAADEMLSSVENSPKS